jgi:hypothetical protein
VTRLPGHAVGRPQEEDFDMNSRILTAVAVVALGWGTASVSAGQSSSDVPVAHPGQAQQAPAAPMNAGSVHEHGAAVPAITYDELQRTAEQLAAARQATAKYQDVRNAEADGYRPIGPDVPGMGLHYVRKGDRSAFSITEPPILLYERDDEASGGLRLVGLSYLVVSPADADGQPANSPFPRALATWHKHNNVCVLADNSASVELTSAQCTARGGRFSAETSWMVHAWIWKDSPTGMFSPTNPLVK